ncbi:hypothetical protein [Dyella tabacisoli]|nr:hypothetical protein [Dyella tabacisoli]
MIRFEYKLRSALLIGLLTATAWTAHAQTTPQVEVSDLGNTNPQAADVSVSPNWHVYVFHRDGIKYVQINDQQDQVRAAFATRNGLYLVLPIGSDAQQVSTPQQPLAFNGAAALGETVYLDSSVKVVMAPQSGGVQWQVQAVVAPINTKSISIPQIQIQMQMQTATCKLQSCGGDFMAY